MDFGIKKKKKTIKPDKSDFSTQETKPNVSDFANKNKFKPKVKVKDTSGKFSSDAGVKPRVNTFTADTNAAKNTNKDRSDFASSKSTKTKKVDKKTTKTDKPTSFGAAFRAARAKQGAGGVFTYKGKKFSTNKASDKKNTKTKKVVKKAKSSVVQPPKRAPRGANKIVSSMKSSKAGVDAAPGDNKKSKPKFFKGTNITPTATQQKRRRNT